MHDPGRALIPAGLPGQLVHPDIVHPQELREAGRRVRIPGPVAADRQVEDDEERKIVHPFPGKVRGADLEILRVVHVPADLVRLPFDGEHMERIRKRALGDRGGLTHAGAPGVSRPVHGPIHAAGFAADMLHDVDLAATGPARLVYVRPQHPEGRPDPLPEWKLHAGFDPAVREGVQVLGGKAGGGVIAVEVLLGARFQDQHAALDARVFGAVGIVLPFVVSPAAAADIKNPIGGVDRPAREFVLPDQIPAGTHSLRGGGGGRCRIRCDCRAVGGSAGG